LEIPPCTPPDLQIIIEAIATANVKCVTAVSTKLAPPVGMRCNI